jgi:hypothetical protein
MVRLYRELRQVGQSQGRLVVFCLREWGFHSPPEVALTMGSSVEHPVSDLLFLRYLCHLLYKVIHLGAHSFF